MTVRLSSLPEDLSLSHSLLRHSLSLRSAHASELIADMHVLLAAFTFAFALYFLAT